MWGKSGEHVERAAGDAFVERHGGGSIRRCPVVSGQRVQRFLREAHAVTRGGRLSHGGLRCGASIPAGRGARGGEGQGGVDVHPGEVVAPAHAPGTNPGIPIPRTRSRRERFPSWACVAACLATSRSCRPAHMAASAWREQTPNVSLSGPLAGRGPDRIGNPSKAPLEDQDSWPRRQVHRQATLRFFPIARCASRTSECGCGESGSASQSRARRCRAPCQQQVA